MSKNSVLGRALRAERRSVLWALSAGVSLALCIIGLSASSAWLLFRSSQRPPVLSLTVMMGLVQLFALGRSATRYAERTLIHRAGLGALGRVRLDVLQAVTKLLPAGLGPRSDSVLATVLSDVESVQQFLTASLAPIVVAAAGSLFTLLLAKWIAHSVVVVFVILMLTGIVLPFISGRLRRSSEEHIEHAQLDLRLVSSRALRDSDGTRTSGRLAMELDALARAEGELSRALSRRAHWQGMIRGATLGINGVGVAWLTLHGLALFHRGAISWPLVAVMPLTLITTLDLLEATSGLFATVPSQLRALRRIDDLFQKTPPVQEPAQALARTTLSQLELQDLTPMVGDTALAPVTTFSLSPGEILTIVGPSGVGKSSLARAIVRFVSYRGSLAANGIELARWLGVDVRGSIGMVDDSPHVFATSLRENLLLARPEASDNELREALATAGLDDLLSSMPDGLDTQLGGRTDQISGGERRRLGLARELLTSRPIAILDEPTEGLDRATSDQVLASLAMHYRQGALIVISHLELQALGATKRVELAY